MQEGKERKERERERVKHVYKEDKIGERKMIEREKREEENEIHCRIPAFGEDDEDADGGEDELMSRLSRKYHKEE